MYCKEQGYKEENDLTLCIRRDLYIKYHEQRDTIPLYSCYGSCYFYYRNLGYCFDKQQTNLINT